MAKGKKRKDQLINELEGVVDVLSMDMSTAMDIKKEKENLKDKIRRLKKEESYLKDMVKHLKATQAKLESELSNKDHEEEKLRYDLKKSRTDKRKTTAKNAALQARVERLVEEKKSLSASLVRMNDIIIKLKSHISDFDQDIKSEV